MTWKAAAVALVGIVPQFAAAQTAIEIISKGTVISSAALTDFEVPKYGAPTPSDLRVHELFVLYDDALFLCHILANKGDRDAPRATCYGQQ